MATWREMLDALQLDDDVQIDARVKGKAAAYFVTRQVPKAERVALLSGSSAVSKAAIHELLRTAEGACEQRHVASVWVVEHTCGSTLTLLTPIAT
jgi:hypothetical protein